MNKVKFKSPSGKVTTVGFTQKNRSIDRHNGKSLSFVTRYMMSQGFVRCGLRAS